MSENVPLAFVFGDQAHLWLTTKNQSGTLTTPIPITIDIFDSADTQVVTDGVTTESSTGVHYYTYPVPAAGPEGVWTVEWSYTMGGDDYVHKEYMEVFDMVPFTYDTLHPDVVRKMLVNISEDQLPDATIRMALKEAEIFCVPLIGGDVSDSDKNLGILVYARYLAYDKYLLAFERVEGRAMPIFLSLHSDKLKDQALAILEALGTDDADAASYTHPTVAGRSMRSYPYAWRDL